MGGDIFVVSKKGSGSVFSFDFRFSDLECVGNEVFFFELSECLIMIVYLNLIVVKIMVL